MLKLGIANAERQRESKNNVLVADLTQIRIVGDLKLCEMIETVEKIWTELSSSQMTVS